MQYSLSFYNIDNNQTYQLPFDSVKLIWEMPGLNLNLLRFETNFMLIDSFLTKDTLHIMYKKYDKYYISLLNLVDCKEIKKSEITNPANTLKVGMYFNSADELYYLTKDNRLVVEKINYK